MISERTPALDNAGFISYPDLKDNINLLHISAIRWDLVKAYILST
jgi:hypothetical protein